MPQKSIMTEPLLLRGLDGANPLGFLAALGVAITSHGFSQEVRLSWSVEQGGWHPMLWNCGDDKEQFLEALHKTLKSVSMAPFEIDKKLPFATDSFLSALRKAQEKAAPKDRRTTDFLAAFGSEIHEDKGVFKDTSFRMVRSGDSSGQGLPAYALAIHKATDKDALRRALFEPWDYRDDDFSLRWDPLEDQRYALRWNDPSKAAKNTMRGANALALQALMLFPTQPQSNGTATTGFFKASQRREFFSWPIWDQPLSLDVIRSLLYLADLHRDAPPRTDLVARGIVEIYHCERVAPNKYYKNFTPAIPT